LFNILIGNQAAEIKLKCNHPSERNSIM